MTLRDSPFFIFAISKAVVIKYSILFNSMN